MSKKLKAKPGGGDAVKNQLSAKLKSARGIGLSAEELRSEKAFLPYLKLLKKFAERYGVFITSADTPCGPAFTPEVGEALMELGLNINLSGKDRHSYAAAINAGELIFEEISPTTLEPVEYEGEKGDISIKLESVGFNVPKNIAGLVVLDGKQYSPSGRGLNFVVYDLAAKNLIDAVQFDTYSNLFPCRRPAETVEAVLEYARSHPEISVVCFNNPVFPDKDLSANEKFILKNAVSRSTILQNLDKPIFAICKYFKTPEDMAEALCAPKSYHDINGVRRFEDIRGRCVNISDGHRVTCGQPEKYTRTVYVLGDCKVFGVGSPDEETSASHLQRLLNERSPEQGLIVQNYGFFFKEMGDTEGEERADILNALPVKPGDIVLCGFGWSKDITLIDISDAGKRPHTYGELFFDTMHYTGAGNKLIAQKIFEGLENHSFFSKSTAGPGCASAPPYFGAGLDEDARAELTAYKKILTDFYNEMFGVTIGCIVMNCNPFTLGHRYLIEQALSMCGHLIIFVVEEDLSVFPFEDRLALVDMGVTDLPNVTVIPSGRFVLSSLTFSEYFNKSEIQERTIDTSLDVSLFAREIAPCLNIKIRFAGEEPLDNITNQYNKSMKDILPGYGIKFVEISRKEISGAPVSASRVRALLEKRDFSEIEKLVPATTLEYLKERFDN